MCKEVNNLSSPLYQTAIGNMRTLTEEDIADLKHAFASGERIEDLAKRKQLPRYRVESRLKAVQ